MECRRLCHGDNGKLWSLLVCCLSVSAVISSSGFICYESLTIVVSCNASEYVWMCVCIYLGQKHDVFVTAIDLSTNMISIAQEKANEINDPRVCVTLYFLFVVLAALTTGLLIAYLLGSWL